MLLSLNYCVPSVPEPEESELLNELAGRSAVWKETLSRRVQVRAPCLVSCHIAHVHSCDSSHSTTDSHSITAP
jgi:hypothetical protein